MLQISSAADFFYFFIEIAVFKNFFGGEFGLIQQFHWAWEIFEKSMKKMFQTLSITEKLSDLHSVWTGWLVFLRRIDF